MVFLDLDKRTRFARHRIDTDKDLFTILNSFNDVFILHFKVGLADGHIQGI